MTQAAPELAAEIFGLRNVAAMRQAVREIEDKTIRDDVGVMIKYQLYMIKHRRYYAWCPTTIKPEHIAE